ncbi:hypothetical protein, partial [Xylella taiwanensis]
MGTAGRGGGHAGLALAGGAAERDAAAEGVGYAAFAQGLDFVQGTITGTEGAVEGAYAVQRAELSRRGMAGVSNVGGHGLGEGAQGAAEANAKAAVFAGLLLLSAGGVVHRVHGDVDAADVDVAGGNQVDARGLDGAFAGVDEDVAIEGG